MLDDRRRELGKNLGLLVLRVSAGGMMAFAHGWGKFMTYGERSAKFADPFGIGSAASLALVVFAELVCALLVAAGLATRLACVPLVITMAVAAFWAHAADPFQKKELALFYMAVFSTLALTGPGRFSADAKVLPGCR